MIFTWSIVNNEMDFLQDVIEYHLPWVDGMYILDTGSTDGTWEYLQSLNDPKIHIEQYHTKYIPQWDVCWQEMSEPFPEVEVRNYALQQVEKFNPTWLIQLDGDEVFLSHTKQVIEQYPNQLCIGHSTINPVCELEYHVQENRGGYLLYDPHARIWKANQGVKYINNPTYKGKQYHCIPVLNNRHLYHQPKMKFVNDFLHFHLHWMYGRKVEAYYQKKGCTQKDEMSRRCENKAGQFLPEIFWQRRQEWIDSK